MIANTTAALFRSVKLPFNQFCEKASLPKGANLPSFNSTNHNKIPAIETQYNKFHALQKKYTFC